MNITDELLPIGSVVLLKESTKRVMITGVCQRSAADPEKIWDYAGVLYPEGYIAPDKLFLFNRDRIDILYCLGYRDREQMEFQKKAETALQHMRE